MGLPDGGIAVWEETAKKGHVVRVPGVSGVVRALAVGEDTVYWTAGTSDKVYAFHTKDKSVKTFDASERVASDTPEESPAPPLDTSSPWIERMAALGKNVVLMGESGTRIWDNDSGLKPLTDVFAV